jgi:Cys-rich repeat protein
MRARDRWLDLGGPLRRMSRSAPLWARAALLAAVLLVGCGGLSTPDLSQGEVDGQLTGAFQAGAAYAYVFGAPATKSFLAADGSYVLSGAPVGGATVVLFDGVSRAGTVTVEVLPATRSEAASVDVSALAAARSIYVAVSCTGGSSGENTTYSVDGAALLGPASGEAATLFPLPPGQFTVRASLTGFLGAPVQVDLTLDESAQVEFGLGLDGADASEEGCHSNSCSAGLYCGSDGQCYACTSDDDCGTGAECIDHLCAAPSLRTSCDPCTTSSDCGAGPSGEAPLCIATPPDVSVCSYSCSSNADCAAGFLCESVGGANACVPALGCSGLFQAFHTPCFTDAACAASGLKCLPTTREMNSVGFCTAPCTSDADCPTALGYHCDGSTSACSR